jgi:hypothetical protein
MEPGDELAKIDAQRAYFASDERIVERAAVWRDATPEECLAATAEECAAAEQMLAIKSPEELGRALAPAPIPEDTIAILEALQRASK